MLELASSCLESGARFSLRRTRPSTQRRQSLHTTFWDHNVANLELPVLNFDTSAWSSRWTAQHQHKKETNHDQSETGLLDFLYPRQAIAWLSRAPVVTQEEWQRRNTRRLPCGFISTTRSYSSPSAGWKIKSPEKASPRVPDATNAEDEAFHEADIYGMTTTSTDHGSINDWDRDADSHMPKTPAPPLYRQLRDLYAGSSNATEAGDRTEPQGKLSGTGPAETGRPTIRKVKLSGREDDVVSRHPLIRKLELVSGGSRHRRGSDQIAPSDETIPGPSRGTAMRVLKTLLLRQDHKLHNTEDFPLQKLTSRQHPSRNKFQHPGKKRLISALTDPVWAGYSGADMSYIVEPVWALFQGLNQDAQSDPKVVESLMHFFSHADTTSSNDHIIQLYNNTPITQRTPAMYFETTTAFMSMGLVGLVHTVYHEALSRNIEEVSRLAPAMVLHALSKQLWMQAVTLYKSLSHQSTFATAVEHLSFWRNVIGLEQDLLPHAHRLALYLQCQSTVESTEEPTSLLQFGLQFCRVAILKHIRQVVESNHTHDLTHFENLREVEGHVVQLCQKRLSPRLAERYLGELLVELLDQRSGITDQDTRQFAYVVYKQWLSLATELASDKREAIFRLCLDDLVARRRSGQKLLQGDLEIELTTLAKDWVDSLGQINKEASMIIASEYATTGALPEYRLHTDVSGTPDEQTSVNEIILHASRRDIPAARAAFEKAYAEAKRQERVLSLRHWNALIKAYYYNNDLAMIQDILLEVTQHHQIDEDTVLPLLKTAVSRVDMIMLNQTLRLFKRCGNTKLTPAMFGEIMQAIIAKPQDPGRSVCHNVFTMFYSTALSTEQSEFLRKACNHLLEDYGWKFDEAALTGLRRLMKKLDMPEDAKILAVDASMLAAADVRRHAALPSSDLPLNYLNLYQVKDYARVMRALLLEGHCKKVIKLRSIMSHTFVLTAETHRYFLEALTRASSAQVEGDRRNRLREELKLLIAELAILPTARRPRLPPEEATAEQVTDLIAMVIRALIPLETEAQLNRDIVQYSTARGFTASDQLPLSMLAVLLDVNDHHGDVTAFDETWERALQCAESQAKQRDITATIDNIVSTRQQSSEVEPLQPEVTERATLETIDNSKSSSPDVTPQHSSETDDADVGYQLLQSMRDEFLGPILLPSFTLLQEKWAEGGKSIVPRSHDQFLLSRAHRIRTMRYIEARDWSGLVHTMGRYIDAGLLWFRADLNKIIGACNECEPPLTGLAFYLTEQYLMGATMNPEPEYQSARFLVGGEPRMRDDRIVPRRRARSGNARPSLQILERLSAAYLSQSEKTALSDEDVQEGEDNQRFFLRICLGTSEKLQENAPLTLERANAEATARKEMLAERPDLLVSEG